MATGASVTVKIEFTMFMVLLNPKPNWATSQTPSTFGPVNVQFAIPPPAVEPLSVAETSTPRERTAFTPAQAFEATLESKTVLTTVNPSAAWLPTMPSAKLSPGSAPVSEERIWFLRMTHPSIVK